MYSPVSQIEKVDQLEDASTKCRRPRVALSFLLVVFVLAMFIIRSGMLSEKKVQSASLGELPDEDLSLLSSGEGVGLIGKGKESVEMLMKKCPNWSKEFAVRFQTECGGYWMERFEYWELKVTQKSKEVAYYCEDEADCRGWGDRIGGIEAAFFKALSMNAQFKMGHKGLNELFSPCLFKSKWTNWASSAKSFIPRHDSCVVTAAKNCGGWLHMGCTGSSIVTKNTDRTCIYPETCKTLLATRETVTASNVFGCGLRAILEPSKTFFEETMYPLKLEKGKRLSLSLREIEAYLKQFYVISIQFRLGDAIAFYKKGEIDVDDEDYLRPFRCAQTLESYLTGGRLNGTVNGKQVMWFIASDSQKLKLAISSKFPGKLLMLDMKPEHVALTGTGTNELQHTIAEWIVLGLGDEMVVNRIGSSKSFYRGRMSGFPKSSWAYHLKHYVYDSGKCVKMDLPFEGIWEDAKEKSCGKGRTLLMSHQEHLAPLQERNLSFPDAYVLNGHVVNLGKVKAQENDDHDEDDDDNKGN